MKKELSLVMPKKIGKGYRGTEKSKVTKMEIQAEQLKKFGFWNEVDQS